MTTSIRVRGELPFPVAGEGVILRFTNPDCDQLQKEFGDNWFLAAVERCNRFDMAYLRKCVEVGVKKDGKHIIVKYDALDCTIVEIAQSVLDALFLAMHGRTFDDHLEYMDSRAKVAITKDEPGNE